MPLRRKISIGRKNSSSSDGTPNGKIDTLMKEKPAIIQECDLSCIPSAQDKQRRSSTRSGSWTSTEEDKNKEGRARRESSGSISSKGIARVRRTSRECVIPENIDVSGMLNISDCPMFSIEDCGYADVRQKSRPITLQRIQSEDRDCVAIRELSESPQRYRFSGSVQKSEVPVSRLSVASQDSVDGATFPPPSSPLLVAMRTAVDSLNQYEDFEILEEIGAGFFAQVFKVSWFHCALSCEVSLKFYLVVCVAVCKGSICEVQSYWLL